MKKIIAIILCLLFAFYSVAFALTDNEIKYKWNKLDIVITTKTGLTATWSESYSQYGGSGTLRATTQDISNWYITKGGEKISEYDFLIITGQRYRANQINDEVSAKLPFLRAVAILSIAGLACFLVALANPIKANQSLGYGGAGVFAVGYIVATLFGPPEHYLSYREVGEKIDYYNSDLKKELNIDE